MTRSFRCWELTRRVNDARELVFTIADINTNHFNIEWSEEISADKDVVSLIRDLFSRIWFRRWKLVRNTNIEMTLPIVVALITKDGVEVGIIPNYLNTLTTIPWAIKWPRNILMSLVMGTEKGYIQFAIKRGLVFIIIIHSVMGLNSNGDYFTLGISINYVT